MFRRLIVASALALTALSALLLVPGCASKPEKPAPKPAVPVVVTKPVEPETVAEVLPPVMLGIDVLEAEGFRAVAGKKIGLLTHPAGVNRRGESTIDVLRRAHQTKLVALFGPEHGIYGEGKAGDNIADTIDSRTGLPVFSLYGKNRKPTPAQLKGLDAMVIDLQDIGSRSYTFNVVMAYTMEACFENGVEVIVLDRPNPLGGLKVDGPPLDPDLKSGVGAFRVPYVHGLTMGELARVAKETIGVLAISEKVRQRGKLTVVPMHGWTRRMRWPDTGLKWVATSPMMPNFEATVGYAMVGPGTELGGWTWGVGTFYPFRGIGFPKKTPEQIVAELEQYHIPGIRLDLTQGVGRNGLVIRGVYVEVTDWEAWRPTELSFYMMKTAAKWNTVNPFKAAPADRQSMFNKVVGSHAWWKALTTQGAKVDVASYCKSWSERAAIYQQQSRKYWLYQ